MSNISIPSMQDLLGAGVHFGHKVSRGHPKMAPFIFGAREGVHIIDLAQSEQKLKEAAQEAYKLGKEGKTLLVVGTKKQAKQIIESLAKEADAPYLSQKWIGGILTNFDEIKKNVKKLNDLKEQQIKGELSRYTKKEQLLISRKLEKFEREMGGASNMDKIPDALFLIDAVSELTAVKEAQRVGIKVIGFSDTNADPNWFDFPIPANDDGIKSIKIICETVIKSYGEGRKVSGGAVEPKESPDSSKSATGKDESKVTKKTEKEKDEVIEEPVLDKAVAEEAAVLEEIVEKKIVEESDRKI